VKRLNNIYKVELPILYMKKVIGNNFLVCVSLIFLIMFMNVVSSESFSVSGSSGYLNYGSTAQRLCQENCCDSLTSKVTGNFGFYCAGSPSARYWSTGGTDWTFVNHGNACASAAIIGGDVWNWIVTSVTCDGCGDGHGICASSCDPDTCDDYLFPKCIDSGSDGCEGSLTCNIESDDTPHLLHTYCASSNDLVCETGWKDCNSDMISGNEGVSDGCETSVSGNDVNNCGGCGNLDSSYVCEAGEYCENGVCILPIPEVSTWSNMNGGSISQVDLLDYVRINSNEDLPYQIIGDVVDVEINNKYWQANVSDNNIKFVTSIGDSETTINVLDDSDNEELTVDVLSPKCGANYSLVGEKLNISFTIDDSDDLVFVNVSVDSEVMYSVNNFVKNKFEFVSDFQRAGSVSIVFNGVSSRGDRFRKVSNIMIYDSTDSSDQYYVAACIDKPVNFYETKSSLVEFEATSSRGIKYNNSMTEPEEIDDEYLNFSWSFWNQGGKVLDDCVGLGSQDCNGLAAVDWSVIHFFRRFPTIHDNQATLSVSIPAEAM
jgi:hypothetical protein